MSGSNGGIPPQGRIDIWARERGGICVQYVCISVQTIKYSTCSFFEAHWKLGSIGNNKVSGWLSVYAKGSQAIFGAFFGAWMFVEGFIGAYAKILGNGCGVYHCIHLPDSVWSGHFCLVFAIACSIGPVLRIRDVYPGFKFFPSRIRIFPSRIRIFSIPDPGPRIPDLHQKI